MTTKNLSDLNQHLYTQMERLSKDDLTSAQIEIEAARGAALVAVADQLLRSAELHVKAAKILSDFGRDPTAQLTAIESKK